MLRLVYLGKWACLFAVTALTCGCESSSQLHDYLDSSMHNGERAQSRQLSHGFARNGTDITDHKSDRVDGEPLVEARAAESRGTGKFVQSAPQFETGTTSKGGEGVTLNLVNVPIAQAAKTIFGDILKLNYTVSDQIVGNVTIQSSAPIERTALIEAFEETLKISGATILHNNGSYSIVQSAIVPLVGRGVPGKGGSQQIGSQTQIVSLKNISASEMKRIVEPIVAQGAVLRADNQRNILVVSGTKRELESVNSLIQMFDVDWMKGMSVGLYPVKASDPEAIATELETVMGLNKDGPLKGVVRIMPNRRLGSVLVMSSKPQHLDTAKTWIERFEKAAEHAEPQLYVYKIQNRPTMELAAVLQKVLAAGSSGVSAQSGDVAPKYEVATVTTATSVTPSTPGLSSLSKSGPSSSGTSSPAAAAPEVQSETSISAGQTSPENGSGDDSTQSNGNYRRSGGSRLSSVKVTPDEAKHALLIEALPKEYERILRILERIDIVSTQVMLEAVIAEVSLNDELKFGLKWYFESKPSKFTFSDALSGAVAPVFPGFSYFFSASSMKVALDALSGVTDVNVVSAPSVMVMDNRKAILQIGDQVPIVKQTAQSVVNPEAPIVNSVEMKDTGVILAVTPRVNDSGTVVLDVEQEVSNVAKTTSSGIDSPTIQQRRVKTTVVVGDGEVIALGGLIQQRDEVNKTQVPILGNIPIIGSAFRSKDDNIKRTELVIFIRPQVAKNEDEARQVTEEYRNRINIRRPMETRGRDHYHRDADRILR